MNEKTNYSFVMIAIVAIVAIVGMAVMVVKMNEKNSSVLDYGENYVGQAGYADMSCPQSISCKSCGGTWKDRNCDCGSSEECKTCCNPGIASMV